VNPLSQLSGDGQGGKGVVANISFTEDTLHNHRCEILKSCIVFLCGEATHRYIQRLVLLATCFQADFCSAYCSTLKMEAICSSEMSVHFRRTTQRYIPEDSTLNNQRRKNLKSCVSFTRHCMSVDTVLFAVSAVEFYSLSFLFSSFESSYSKVFLTWESYRHFTRKRSFLVADNLHLSQQILQNSLADAFRCVSVNFIAVCKPLPFVFIICNILYISPGDAYLLFSRSSKSMFCLVCWSFTPDYTALRFRR
jgi:hypothetical protein